MTATATTVTITLNVSTDLPGRIDVRVDGERVGSVVDGAGIVRKADVVLTAARVYRNTGYNNNADRWQLTATGTRLVTAEAGR